MEDSTFWAPDGLVHFAISKDFALHLSFVLVHSASTYNEMIARVESPSACLGCQLGTAADETGTSLESRESFGTTPSSWSFRFISARFALAEGD